MLNRHHGTVIQFAISFTLVIYDLLGLFRIGMHELGDLPINFLGLSILVVERVEHLVQESHLCWVIFIELTH